MKHKYLWWNPKYLRERIPMELQENYNISNDKRASMHPLIKTYEQHIHEAKYERLQNITDFLACKVCLCKVQFSLEKKRRKRVGWTCRAIWPTVVHVFVPLPEDGWCSNTPRCAWWPHAPWYRRSTRITLHIISTTSHPRSWGYITQSWR